MTEIARMIGDWISLTGCLGLPPMLTYQEICIISVQCVKWLLSHFSLESVRLPAFL